MSFLKKAMWPAMMLLIAMGAQPSVAAFWQWSKTAATDATADPTINWAEGMSPSSVNDSARAMMARAAEYRDDISGSLVTTGTSTAYAVSTNQGLYPTTGGITTPADGQMLAITPNVTNADSATLTADGGTTYPIQTKPGTPVQAGVLIAGTPYAMKFSAANSAWILRNFYGNPYSVPLGGLLQSTVATPPNSSFIQPYGQCISTTTYAAYWAAMGSPAPGSCGAGTFAVIDLRGRTTYAPDNMGGVAANRLTSTYFGVAATSIGAVSTKTDHLSLATSNLPPYTPSGYNGGASGSATYSGYYLPLAAGPVQGITTGNQSAYYGAAIYNNSGWTYTSAYNVSVGAAAWQGYAQGGSSTPFSTIGPAAVVNVFLRVL